MDTVHCNSIHVKNQLIAQASVIRIAIFNQFLKLTSLVVMGYHDTDVTNTDAQSFQSNVNKHTTSTQRTQTALFVSMTLTSRNHSACV